MHIVGLILFAGIFSSSLIGQMAVTQKTVVTVLFSEWNTNKTELTTILETSPLKDENIYQDCICIPFHKCKTYNAAPDGNEVIDVRRITSTLVVRAGEWDLKTEKEILNHQDRRVTRIVFRSDYYSSGVDGEVALIFTDHSFSLQDNIQPICLPSKDDIIIKDKCYSSGWDQTLSFNKYTIVKKTESGRTKETGIYKVSILKKYEHIMVPRDKCSIALHVPKDLLQDNYICADGVKWKGKNSGYVGNPLMCPYKNEPNRLVHVGILAWKRQNYEYKDLPALYVNVASIIHWINYEIENREY